MPLPQHSDSLRPSTTHVPSSTPPMCCGIGIIAFINTTDAIFWAELFSSGTIQSIARFPSWDCLWRINVHFELIEDSDTRFDIHEFAIPILKPAYDSELLPLPSRFWCSLNLPQSAQCKVSFLAVDVCLLLCFFPFKLSASTNRATNVLSFQLAWLFVLYSPYLQGLSRSLSHYWGLQLPSMKICLLIGRLKS